MIDLGVENVQGLLQDLKKEGISANGPVESSEYGKLVRILDPERSRIELWESDDVVFEKISGDSRTF